MFWIVDLDVIIKETRESKNNVLQELKNYFSQVGENVVTIVNTPSLEF